MIDIELEFELSKQRYIRAMELMEEMKKRIVELENQEKLRVRHYNNLTADEKHLLNKFFNKQTLTRAISS